MQSAIASLTQRLNSAEARIAELEPPPPPATENETIITTAWVGGQQLVTARHQDGTELYSFTPPYYFNRMFVGGGRILVADYDVTAHDAATGALIKVIPRGTQFTSVTGFAITPDQTRILMLDWFKLVVLDAASMDELASYPLGEAAVGLDVLSNTRALVYQNRFLKEIDLATGNLVQSWEIPFPFTQRSIAHAGDISYLAGQYGQVYALDRSTGNGSTLNLVQPSHVDYDNTVIAASPNGTVLVANTIYAQGIWRMWRISAGQPPVMIATQNVPNDGPWKLEAVWDSHFWYGMSNGIYRLDPLTGTSTLFQGGEYPNFAVTKRP